MICGGDSRQQLRGGEASHNKREILEPDPNDMLIGSLGREPGANKSATPATCPLIVIVLFHPSWVPGRPVTFSHRCFIVAVTLSPSCLIVVVTSCLFLSFCSHRVVGLVLCIESSLACNRYRLHTLCLNYCSN